jgi:phage gp29-like protein
MTKTVQFENRSAKRGTSAGGGKSAAELVRQSNRWRDNYNPIRGLVIARVIYILEGADRGDFAELQLVMRKIERRHPALKGLKARRLAALEKFDWQIKTMEDLPEGATRADAEAQQKFLRSRYELLDNLTEVIGFLTSAEFRGYAILQKHRFNDGGRFDGAVRELHWLPQDQFSRDGQFGDFYYNQNSTFGVGIDSCQTLLGEQNRIGSEQLPREDFVIREVDSPLYEIALIAFVNWCMGRKDWAAFTEIFGLPNGVAIMPANIPPGMEDEYRIAAERVADGVSGALPNGSDIKFPAAGVRGEAPFKDFCDAQDFDVVLAGTGGRLAMLTADKGGLGNGPAREHAEAFDEIAEADANKVNAVLQKDFDRTELAAEFPGQPVLAYFELCAKDRLDVAQLVTNAAALASAGYKVDAEWLGEATGYKFAAKDQAAAATGLNGNFVNNEGGQL